MSCLLFFMCGRMYAQDVTFTSPYPCFYQGSDNAVSIHVAGYNDTDVVAATDNGSVAGQGGHFIFRPDRLQPSTITIYVKTSRSAGCRWR